MISILIPTYNREDIISETIESALAQTYRDIEIVIADNASTDNTWGIIQKFAENDQRIKAFRNETNIGPVRNWKRCFDEAGGEFAKILWSDDLISPDFLEKTLPYLDEDNDIGFVITGTEVFFDAERKKTKNYFVGTTGVYDSGIYIEDALFENEFPFSPGCALFRLKDLRENLLMEVPNNINSDFSMHAIGSDLLIFLLTAIKYKKFAVVNDTLSFFRDHTKSISSGSPKGKLHLHYALAKAYFVENHFDSPEQIKKMNVQLQWLCFLYRGNPYGLNRVSDFYTKNKCYGLSIISVAAKLVQLLRFRNIRKLIELITSKT